MGRIGHYLAPFVSYLLQDSQHQLVFAEWDPGCRQGRYPDLDNLRLAWSEYPVGRIENRELERSWRAFSPFGDQQRRRRLNDGLGAGSKRRRPKDRQKDCGKKQNGQSRCLESAHLDPPRSRTAGSQAARGTPPMNAAPAAAMGASGMPFSYTSLRQVVLGEQ